MSHSKNRMAVVTLLVVAGLLLAACATPTAQVVREEVIVEVTKEVEVVKEVEVTKEVEVVKEVEVTKEVVKEVEVVQTSRGTCGTATLLYWQAASTMNPYLSGGTKDIHAGSVVLESLARYDETGQLLPWLAEEIPTVDNGGISEDLTTITWKLKPGILWADGTPLTAEDAVFSAEYCMNPDMGCNALSNFPGRRVAWKRWTS